ncbi:hypothetical protein [Candidatus Methylacidiphilum infernorum]|uniref:hypothetical protein n=1 Tax=Candidatus Methylacidiphilum infernorum TaxID=511746 RepID=UPI0002E61B27|nr:hypothetical protein [Candidatus Methylacidiphilum infernorum]
MQHHIASAARAFPLSKPAFPGYGGEPLCRSSTMACYGLATGRKVAVVGRPLLIALSMITIIH